MLTTSRPFPTDADQIIQDLKVTHIVAIAPSRIFNSITPSSNTKYLTIGQDMPSHDSVTSDVDFLLSLPEILPFIQQAMDSEGVVLLHSQLQDHAVTAACAHRPSSYLLAWIMLILGSL